ncbi:hypothetical protein ACFT2C_01025 [Promicromonospora sp. NPDC057138]|uniref:hypothetical protein n=1 Tax=Promicromonospora sp. NPDC057138 TaxID=3346031 RepID=UPI00363129B2
MTFRALIALCESRINGLSRMRQALEHSGAPEHVEGLIDDLRGAASDWDEAVTIRPDGDPVALRAGARTVRTGTPGFGAVADALDTYAAALAAGQGRHASGVTQLRAAQQCAAGLPVAGDVDPHRAEAASRAAVAVVDVACAGYAACLDAYEEVRDAEAALYATLAYVQVRRSDRPSDLSA